MNLPYRIRNLRNRWRGVPQEIRLRGSFRPVGTLSARIIRADGTIEDVGILSRRVVTTVGVNFLRDAILGLVEPELLNFHAMGTNNTAENMADTALAAEVESRVAGTQSSGGAGIVRTVATIVATAPRDVVEHGIFSALAAGTLLDRSVFAVLSIGAGDGIEFTYDLALAAGG